MRDITLLRVQFRLLLEPPAHQGKLLDEWHSWTLSGVRLR